MNRIIRWRSTRGFSLVELMIGLSLSVFIILVSLEVFVTARHHFLELKTDQEISLSAAATLSRIRLDLLSAGQGLAQAIRLGVVKGAAVEAQVLRIEGSETEFALRLDVLPGDSKVYLEGVENIKPGHKLCLTGQDVVEVKTVFEVHDDGCVVSLPFIYSYSRLRTRALLLREISIYLDSRSGILRRKVNLGSAQPLCEGVFSFHVEYDPAANLAIVQLIQESRKEHVHELKIFPKNIGLAR